MLYLICTTITRVDHICYEVPYAQELSTYIWGPCYNSTCLNQCYMRNWKEHTLGFDSKSRHLTLYQRKVMSEELPYWPLKQPNAH